MSYCVLDCLQVRTPFYEGAASPVSASTLTPDGQTIDHSTSLPSTNFTARTLAGAASLTEAIAFAKGVGLNVSFITADVGLPGSQGT